MVGFPKSGHKFILNALLECNCMHWQCLLESIHLTYNQLFISSTCALLLQELDLLQYLIVFVNGMYTSLLVRATQGVTNSKNIDFTLDFSCL